VTAIKLPDDGPCAFCAYLVGTRPYTVLVRDDVAAVLVTREQRGLSHLLVVPVRHAPTILDLTDPEADAVMALLRRAAAAIDAAERAPGIAVWQNNGAPAGQAIGHFHFHVAGTLPGGGTTFGEVPEISVDETDEIARKLRRASGVFATPPDGR
jgi:histidine triad (HIT) family protein